jgi:hypothetical protein
MEIAFAARIYRFPAAGYSCAARDNREAHMSERRSKSVESASKKGRRESAIAAGDVVAEATFDLAELVEVEPPCDEGPKARHGARNWRTLLSGASPREVLARLMSNDPLGLRSCIAAVLAERVYLLEHDRVFVRAVARIARFALRYRGQPELELWLRQQVDEAVLELLDEDSEGPRAPSDAPDGLSELARPLSVEPESARAACEAFNRLTFESAPPSRR